MIDKVLTFYLGNRLFGIDITLVKEINRNAEYTSVPGAKPYIAGLFNMRGQIVTLFHLLHLIHYEQNILQKGTACIILKALPNDPNQVGFLIDRSGDVVDINTEDCEQPPANVNGIESEYIQSVVKMRDELLIIINPERIFS